MTPTNSPESAVLTDEQITGCLVNLGVGTPVRLPPGWKDFARAIEQKVRDAISTSHEASPPKGMALVPIRMTRAMQDVISEEYWEWANVLAAAGAVTEEEYEESLLHESAPEPEDERASFQAWCAANRDFPRKWSREDSSYIYSRSQDGGYENFTMHVCWEAWQARAALSTSHEASGEGGSDDVERIMGMVQTLVLACFYRLPKEDQDKQRSRIRSALAEALEVTAGDIRRHVICLCPDCSTPSPQPATTPSADPTLKDVTGLVRCEFDDECDFCKKPFGGSFARLNHVPADVTETEFYICGECIAGAIPPRSATKQPAGEVQEAVAWQGRKYYHDLGDEGWGDWLEIRGPDLQFWRRAVKEGDKDRELRALYTSPPPAAPAVPDGIEKDVARYKKLRGWMSSNVKEGWSQVEQLAAIACYVDWSAFDESLDALPECNVGLMQQPKEPGA